MASARRAQCIYACVSIILITRIRMLTPPHILWRSSCADMQYQNGKVARDAADIMAAQETAYRAELWATYGAAVKECRGPWLNHGEPDALRGCVIQKTGAPIDDSTWRSLQAAETDELLLDLPDRR